jgi:pre-rRNA-processing protein TSR3
MGKSRHQRKLPLIFAANTVNYGKPFKMNTAEAIAAALYIAGFVEDAKTLMYPFSYGQEFLRLNGEAFELYRQCRNELDVQTIMNRYMSNIEEQKEKKEKKKEVERKERIVNANIGGYMDDMDLPPLQSDEEEEEEYEEIAAEVNPIDRNTKQSANAFDLKEMSDSLK